MTNGAAIITPPTSSGAAISGDTATPRLRAIPVTPAAADRSSGSTIAIVYDWRVGTSLWLIAERARSTSAGGGRGGMKGRGDKNTVQGRGVDNQGIEEPNRGRSRGRP